MMMLLLAALAALVTTGSAIIAESIEYEIDGEVFEGYIAYELEWLLDPRPGEHNRLKLLPSLSSAAAAPAAMPAPPAAPVTQHQ